MGSKKDSKKDSKKRESKKPDSRKKKKQVSSSSSSSSSSSASSSSDSDDRRRKASSEEDEEHHDLFGESLGLQHSSSDSDSDSSSSSNESNSDSGDSAEAFAVPKDYTPIQFSSVGLSAERALRDTTELWLFRIPANFDINTLDGVQMEVPDSAEPSPRAKTSVVVGNFKVVADRTATAASLVNLFPSSDEKETSLKLGKPFARHFTVVENVVVPKIDVERSRTTQLEMLLRSQEQNEGERTLKKFVPVDSKSWCAAPAQKTNLQVRTFPFGHPAATKGASASSAAKGTSATQSVKKEKRSRDDDEHEADGREKKRHRSEKSDKKKSKDSKKKRKDHR